MLRTIALFALVTIVSVACSDGDDEKILNSEHEGWEDPVCADCHSDHHNSELDYHECVECHGTNGAPAQPVNTFHTVTCGDAGAGGPGCHENEHGTPDSGFPAGECITCHPASSE